MIIVDFKTLQKSCQSFCQVKVNKRCKEHFRDKKYIQEQVNHILTAFCLIHTDLRDLTTDKFQTLPGLDLKDLKELYKDIVAVSRQLGYCIGFHNFLCNLCKTALFILHTQDERRI